MNWCICYIWTNHWRVRDELTIYYYILDTYGVFIFRMIAPPPPEICKPLLAEHHRVEIYIQISDQIVYVC